MAPHPPNCKYRVIYGKEENETRRSKTIYSMGRTHIGIHAWVRTAMSAISWENQKEQEANCRLCHFREYLDSWCQGAEQLVPLCLPAHFRLGSLSSCTPEASLPLTQTPPCKKNIHFARFCIFAKQGAALAFEPPQSQAHFQKDGAESVSFVPTKFQPSFTVTCSQSLLTSHQTCDQRDMTGAALSGRHPNLFLFKKQFLVEPRSFSSRCAGFSIMSAFDGCFECYPCSVWQTIQALTPTIQSYACLHTSFRVDACTTYTHVRA